MKNMLFIINPYSGKGQIKNKLLEILRLFTEYGYNIRVHVTRAPKDAVAVVRECAADKDIVVCSGGDGTLNEVITGFMHLDKKPYLGYIPAGSTNDYAASLRIPKSMEKAAENILLGEPYAVDIGKFGATGYFLYIAAFGIFTDVAYQTPQDKKNLLGHQAYMLEGVKSLTSIKSYPLRVEWDDQVLEEEFMFGMITNTISVAGFKGIVNQSVSFDDGVFEVLLIRRPKTPLDFSNIVSYLFLKEEPNDYVFKFKAEKLTITAREPIDWVLDGEFGGSCERVEIANLPRQVEIICKREEFT